MATRGILMPVFPKIAVGRLLASYSSHAGSSEADANVTAAPMVPRIKLRLLSSFFVIFFPFYKLPDRMCFREFHFCTIPGLHVQKPSFSLPHDRPGKRILPGPVPQGNEGFLHVVNQKTGMVKVDIF